MSRLRQTIAPLGQTSAVVWVGFAIAGGFVALAVVIVVGSALADPGGWTGFGVAAATLVPVLLLSSWSLLRPGQAAAALAVVALAPVGFGVWTLLDYDASWSWENDNGPLGLILTLAVAGPAVVLGLVRPRPAGVLLLVVSILPGVLAVVGAGFAGSSLFEPFSVALVTAPIVVGGLLYLLAPAGSPAQELAGESREHSNG